MTKAKAKTYAVLFTEDELRALARLIDWDDKVCEICGRNMYTMWPPVRQGTMTDYQTYRSREAAEADILAIRGWDARPTQINLDDGPAWVIECRERHQADGHGSDEPRYLRTDGYVR